MLTRDDMLRELELLPMWKLRAPVKSILPTAIEAKEIVDAKIAQTGLIVNTDAVVKLEKQSIIKTIASTQFEITLSQNKHWAFVCESLINDEIANDTNMSTDQTHISLQTILLNNIMQALHAEKFTKINPQSLIEIDAKIIVAFGESVAQYLLKSQEKLENMQGKLHAINDSKLIVTNELAYLLAYPQQKAQLWQDMCLARSYLQNLQS